MLRRLVDSTRFWNSLRPVPISSQRSPDESLVHSGLRHLLLLCSMTAHVNCFFVLVSETLTAEH